MIKNALKEEGKIFTPLNIVNVLLDIAKYVGAERILEHHFMDNSAGDGNIVVAAISRYCVEHIRVKKGNTGLKEALETYIHAIELNKSNFRQLKLGKPDPVTCMKATTTVVAPSPAVIAA